MSVDADEIRVGDIVVSPHTRRVVVAGREIGVTSREFEVLATMASHPGWVYSPEQLCSDAPESNSSPEAVNVHVSHLRRKLAEAGFPDVIATVRGAGYKVHYAPSEGVSPREAPWFVGRSRELETLAGALADTRAGRSRFVLITGEAGIGKTTLVERSIADASDDPPTVLRAVCDADGSPQYWLWRQLIGDMPLGVQEGADWGLVRHLVGGSGAGDAVAPVYSPADRMVAHDAVLRLLAAVCSGPAPVEIFIDDLQWAETASLNLLSYVLKRTDAMRLLVVVTCREESLNADERLARFVADACGTSDMLHLRLHGLEPEHVAAIAERALGDRARDVAGRIHALTGGNPLFVRELVRALVEYGEEPGVGDALAHLPATVDALVRARITGLPEATGQVLAAAAVVGVEFDAELVGRVCGRVGGVVSALEPALGSRFVIEAETPGRFRFRHPLFRQALYESLAVPERQRIHASVYEAIRSSARSQSRRIFELAHHASLAGPAFSGKAVGCLAAAERESFRRYGFEEASRHAEHALKTLDATSFSPETASRIRAVLLERLGESRSAEGACRAALTAYEAALAERRHEEHAACARLHTRIADARLTLGEWNESRSALDLADACLAAIDERGDGWWSDWIHARLQRAEYEFVSGDAGGTALDPALAEAVAVHASPAQHVSFLEKRAAALWQRAGYAPTDECVAAAREAAEVAASRSMEYAHARAVELLGGVLVWHRDLEEAEEVLGHALNLMRRCQDPIAEACVLFYRTISARFAGDVTLTDARARELLGHTSVVPTPEFAGAARGCLAWAALRRGERGVAEESAREGMGVLKVAHSFPYAWTAAWPSAVCELAAGRLREAVSCAVTMLDERQEALPDAVTRPLRDAVARCAAGDPTAARALFAEAAAQAALLGYA